MLSFSFRHWNCFENVSIPLREACLLESSQKRMTYPWRVLRCFHPCMFWQDYPFPFRIYSYRAGWNMRTSLHWCAHHWNKIWLHFRSSLSNVKDKFTCLNKCDCIKVTTEISGEYQTWTCRMLYQDKIRFEASAE